MIESGFMVGKEQEMKWLAKRSEIWMIVKVREECEVSNRSESL